LIHLAQVRPSDGFREYGNKLPYSVRGWEYLAQLRGVPLVIGSDID
jgi:hypothetical protein